MSSVVKKLKGFVPKIKKAIKRRPLLLAGLTTPPATQASEASTVNDVAETPSRPETATPAATQTEPTEAAPFGKLIPPSIEENAVADSDDEEPTPTEKTLRQLLVNRRALMALRRLSGITPLHVRSPLIDTDKTPTKIGAPRRALISKSQKDSVVAILPPRKEPTPVLEEDETEETPAPVVVPLEPEDIPEGDYVLAIAPDGRLRKHKVVRGENGEVIPAVANVPHKKKRLTEVDKELMELSGEKTNNKNTPRYPKRRAKKDAIQRLSYVEEVDDGDRDIYQEKPQRKRTKTEPVGELVYSNQLLAIKGHHQLPRSVNSEDRELWENVKIDEGEFLMKDFCKPLFPLGKVSENFAMATEAEENRRLARLKRKKQRDRARKEGKSIDDIIDEDEGEKQEETTERPSKSILDTDFQPKALGPKLMYDLTGKLIVDAESTHVHRNTTDFSDRERLVSNPYENPVISSTYSNRRYSDRWTPQETEKLYQALSTFGTDFTMISKLFPHRTRKQVKLKFNLEEKKYPEIIELALRRKLPPDFAKYCEELKLKIELMDFYNKELLKVKEEHEAHMMQIEEERERAIREDQEATRKREFEIRTGVKPMTHRERMQELRKNETVIGEVGTRVKEQEA